MTKEMKKLIYILSAVLLVAACTEKMAPEGAVTTICASLEQVVTKSALDGMAVVWSEGDQIKVYNATTPEGKIYTLTSGAGTSFGTFSTDDPVTGAGPYEAVYPADAVTGASGGRTVILPSTQNYVAGSFGSGANIALAQGSDPANLPFRNAGGILRLTVRGEATIQSIEVLPRVSEALCGGFRLATNPLSLQAPDVAFDLYDPVTLDCGTSGVALTSKGVDFHIFLPAPTLSDGFKAVIHDTDGGSMTVLGKGGGYCHIYRSMIRPMPTITYTPTATGQGTDRPYLSCYEVPAIALKAGTTYGSGSEKSGCGYKWYNHETANANQMVATHTYKYNGKVYRNYTCLVDKTKKAPLWSAFVMHKDAYPDNSVGRSGSWTDDPAIPSGWQQSGVDSPYSRGNFVASNYRQVCDDANKATFYHTNQAPQYQTSFNDGVWNSLENAVKSYAPTGRDTLYVVVGVLYETSQTSSGVPIPSHFYKLLMKCSFDDGGTMTAAKGVAYLFTNEAHSGDKYTDAKFRTTIDAIEERSGFNFFANVPAALQEAAEQQMASLW